MLWTGYKLGSEKHTVEVVVKSDGEAEVTSGVSELSLLKTTQVKNSSTCIMWSTMCRVTYLYLESLTYAPQFQDVM